MATIDTSEIETAATSPAAASVDGVQVTARSLDELIKAKQFLDGQSAGEQTNSNGGPRSGWGMLRIAKARPGGGPG